MALATPWVTHETHTTPQPARQANAYFSDSGISHLGRIQFCGLETTDNVDELFDTQLMLFAKRLSTLDISDVTTSSNMARTPKKLSMAILMTTHWRLPSTPPTAKWCYTMAIMARIFPTATAGRV
jgi:hypothetical protein